MKTVKIGLYIFALLLVCSWEPGLSSAQNHYLLPKGAPNNPSLQFSVPNPSNQVVDPQTFEELGSQKSTLEGIKDRLTSIGKDIDELRADVKSLQETATIMNFLLGGFKVVVGLVLGIIVTALFNKLHRDKHKDVGPPVTT